MPPKTTRVIVVGTDPSLRERGVQQLRSRGLSVRLAPDPIMGVSFHRTVPANLVVIEALLPGEGLSALGAFRGVTSELPAVLLTHATTQAELATQLAGTGRIRILALPLNGESLLTAVDGLLSAEPELEPEPELKPEPEPAPEPELESDRHTVWARETAAVPPRGSLAGYRLADMLHMCAQRRTTGTLLLEHEGHRKTIFIEHGHPIFVKSSLQHETLGTHLLRTKVITEEQHHASIAEMARSGKRHGEVLIEMGAIRASEVLHYLNEHIHHKAVSAFAWYDGTYELSEVDELPDELTAVRMNPCRLVIEGLRMHFDPARLPADFPAEHCTVGVQLEAPPYSESQLALSEHSRGVYDQLIAGVAATAITRAANLPLGQVMGVAYALYVLQVVGFSDAPNEGAEVEELSASESSGSMQLAELDLQGVAPECDQFLEDYLRMRPLDSFQLLGVTVADDDTTVAAAYERLRKDYEPTRFDAAVFGDVRDKIDELWNRIEEAHAALSTSDGRESYRRSLMAREYAEAGQTGRQEALTGERLFRAGLAALTLQHLEEAASAFAGALQQSPQEPAYVAHAGWTAYLMDPVANRATAVERLQAAMTLDPGYAEARHFMGRICLREGNAPLAVGYFEAAVRADPENEEARRYLHIAAQQARQRAQPDAAPGSRGLFGRLFNRD